MVKEIRVFQTKKPVPKVFFLDRFMRLLAEVEGL